MNKTFNSLFPIQKGIQISIGMVGLFILVKEMHNNFFLCVKSHMLDQLNTIKYDTFMFNEVSLWDKHSLGIWLPSLGNELSIILCLWSLSILCYFQPSFRMNKWIWRELWVVDWKVQGTIRIGYEGTWRHLGFELNVFFCHETSLLWNWLNNQLQLLNGKNESKMKPIFTTMVLFVQVGRWVGFHYKGGMAHLF